MKAIKKVLKDGRITHDFVYQEDEFREAFEAHLGLCLACGVEADGCEPDARWYFCEACGEGRVFGLEELLIRGKVAFEPA